jgi:opacity protein-like surface antigen
MANSMRQPFKTNSINMKKVLSICLLLPCMCSAQQNVDKESGYFQIGIRNAYSVFSDDGANGFGYGGQFRIRVLSRVNTDWFADYITTDIAGIAKREDMHIGWSILTYPFNYETTKGKLTPYLLVGHCFDYTKVSKNNSPEFKEKWSSAVQGGLGAHYNITDRMDISLTAQYMMHLGKDAHAEVSVIDGEKDVEIIQKKISGVEGHLLINVSFNVLLFDMWDQHHKRKKTAA